jgi:hypothetical protein
MSSYMLDLVRSLIKTRDELAEMESKINYLRRRVDGLANDLVDRVTELTFEELKKETNASETGSSEVEQSVVGRGCTQEGGARTDGDDEGRE